MQGKDAVEREVQDLKRELGGKKARAEASTIETNEGMPADAGDLDLADHCCHATQWWNRCQVELSSLEEAPAPRTGKDGYLEHPRLGLMGCDTYWEHGGMAHAVTMIVALTVKLGITDRVRNALPETKSTRDAKTSTKIVLLKAGLAETKKSSICSPVSGRITRVRASTMASVLSWSNGD